MSKTLTTAQPTAQQLEEQFTKACRLHETGQLSKALKSYKQLLVTLPSSALLHFNCGLALFETGDFLSAEEHYQLAANAHPEDPDIHYNRGLNFRRLIRLRDAASSFEEAFRRGDTSVDTLYNLALCHQDMEEYQEASRIYDRILEHAPDHLSTLNNYAFLCHKTGKTKKAEALYGQLLHHNPQHKAARHMLNSLRGETPDTAPLEYVEAIFDNYAMGFEESLVEKLHYQTPNALLELYLESFPDELRQNGVDLGCGTGLAGLHFKSHCSKLSGVDISEKMLAVAREKDIYASLNKDDILNFLQASQNHYDMILAADVFTYMGDLAPLFKECASHASAGALFLFSVEETEAIDYALKPSGRFGHSQSYVETLAKNNAWQKIGRKHSRLRKDGDQWIWGHLFIFQKEHSDTAKSLC